MRTELSDTAIRKEIAGAKTDKNVWLEAAQKMYLAASEPEQVILNRSIRRLANTVRNLGVITALEVLHRAGIFQNLQPLGFTRVGDAYVELGGPSLREALDAESTR